MSLKADKNGTTANSDIVSVTGLIGAKTSRFLLHRYTWFWFQSTTVEKFWRGVDKRNFGVIVNYIKLYFCIDEYGRAQSGLLTEFGVQNSDFSMTRRKWLSRRNCFIQQRRQPFQSSLPLDRFHRWKNWVGHFFPIVRSGIKKICFQSGDDFVNKEAVEFGVYVRNPAFLFQGSWRTTLVGAFLWNNRIISISINVLTSL